MVNLSKIELENMSRIGNLGSNQEQSWGAAHKYWMTMTALMWDKRGINKKDIYAVKLLVAILMMVEVPRS